MESMSTRILHVVANASRTQGAPDLASDALPDLAEAWRVLAEAGIEQLLVSPEGGPAGLDVADGTGQARSAEAVPSALLARTAAPAQIDAGDFDAVVCSAGGADALAAAAHRSGGLERIVRSVASHGGVVTAIGHADCDLVRLAGATAEAAAAGSAAEVARALLVALARR
jgi:putative intracellular protease/amidase